MATKSLFQGMLNQNLPKAPNSDIKPKAAPGSGIFAYLNGPTFKHPLENKGGDVASGIWGKMLKGKKNV